MKDRQRELTRRQVLAGGAGLTLAGLAGSSRTLGASSPAEVESGAAAKSRVVLIRRQEVLLENGQIDGEVLHEMLNEGLQAFCEVGERRAAWRELFAPDDVVGVKTNAWRHLPTPAALEEAMTQELSDLGVAAENLSVDDRGVRDNPVFSRATALINVRPMRTHHWSGLGTCIKNYIMFVRRPADYHGDACASLGSIWKDKALAAKTRLNVLVMLTPQFHGIGPHSFSSRFTWPYCGLILGRDPVAVDATGARIIAARRQQYFGGERPVSPPAHHIEIAGSRYHLGRSAPQDIELIRLGWDEESLI